MKKLFDRIRPVRVSGSTVMELVGFGLLMYGVASFSIPIAAIVGGVLLIAAGGFAA